MAVKYAYNKATIEAGAVTSGTAKTVGSAADFERIKNLAPVQVSLEGLVSSTAMSGLSLAAVTGSKLSGTGSGYVGTTAKSIALELTKVSGDLKAKITLS